MPSETFSTPGNNTFTVPDNITEIIVECWGSGGAGGGFHQPDGVPGYWGGGGGGGSYAKATLNVSPGQQITVNVGKEDVGGSTRDTEDEYASWVGSPFSIKAAGGSRGGGPLVSGKPRGGLGGVPSGFLLIDGNPGGKGGDGAAIAADIDFGGGGGGAGGLGGAGGDGKNASYDDNIQHYRLKAGGIGVGDFIEQEYGNGGVPAPNISGIESLPHFGDGFPVGGGGAGFIYSTTFEGGNGASGRVRISWGTLLEIAQVVPAFTTEGYEGIGSAGVFQEISRIWYLHVHNEFRKFYSEPFQQHPSLYPGESTDIPGPRPFCLIEIGDVVLERMSYSDTKVTEVRRQIFTFDILFMRKDAILDEPESDEDEVTSAQSSSSESSSSSSFLVQYGSTKENVIRLADIIRQVYGGHHLVKPKRLDFRKANHVQTRLLGEEAYIPLDEENNPAVFSFGYKLTYEFWYEQTSTPLQ